MNNEWKEIHANLGPCSTSQEQRKTRLFIFKGWRERKSERESWRLHDGDGVGSGGRGRCGLGN